MQSAPSAPSSHSLRRRLLASVMSAIVLAALFQAISAYRGALAQADAMFDYHLQQMAYALRGGPPLAVPLLEGVDNNGVDYVIQIWGPDGSQLFQSNRMALPARAVLGFSDVTQNGTRYRVYSVQTPAQTIQIAQDMDGRESRARALAARAMLPMALIAPLLMLILWWVIRRSLAPLERTRQQVAVRAVNDLSPLSDHELPDEVRPLVQEINLLFGRLDTAFDAQKAFVANAAHELRSPLTALKLQAQALVRTGDETSRTLAAGRLNQGIERAIRLMNQLLVLARQESDGTTGTPMQRLNLHDLVQQAVADVLPLAQERPVDLGVVPSAPASVLGDADALLILLRNLLENAIKYTPPSGQIDVSVQHRGNGVCLTVEDSGPGIAPADRAHVFDRFFRTTQANASGSGLGLAIAQAIAERHHAGLALGRSERLGGLQVELLFEGQSI
jgi:two-component system OmpR family sensor kinase